MVIIAGHLIVDPAERDTYLAGYVDVVAQARRAPGCLDFTVSADLVEPDRINIFEQWESQQAVETFRGSGPSDDQAAAIRGGSVTEYDVANSRRLV